MRSPILALLLASCAAGGDTSATYDRVEVGRATGPCGEDGDTVEWTMPTGGGTANVYRCGEVYAPTPGACQLTSYTVTGDVLTIDCGDSDGIGPVGLTTWRVDYVTPAK